MKKLKKPTKTKLVAKKKKTTKKVVVKKKKTTKVAKKSYYKPKKKIEKNTTNQVDDLGSDNVVTKQNSIVVSELPQTFTPGKRPVKYLNNRDLLAQVLLSKKQEKMTNELAKMLQLLTSRYAKKGNFANYTYNDDMQSYAMLMIVKTWKGFDPAKSSNPFAWFTQCIKNSFIQYLNYEKRQRDVRDEILVKEGLSPSFGYMYEDKQANAEMADQEIMEAPTKLHEDVDTFDVQPDNNEDTIVPESY